MKVRLLIVLLVNGFWWLSVCAETNYVILEKTKSFSEQITKDNTTYEVLYDFDLENNPHIYSLKIQKHTTVIVGGQTYYIQSVGLAEGKLLTLIDTSNCVLIDYNRKNGLDQNRQYLPAIIPGNVAIAFKNEYERLYIGSLTPGTYPNAYKVEDITKLPVGCKLLFCGGRLNNGIIDFTNLTEENIYASWMDNKTLSNSIYSMSQKTLIIDRTLQLDYPLSNRGSYWPISSIKIKGQPQNINDGFYSGAGNYYAYVQSNNCMAIDLYGNENIISDITFAYRGDDPKAVESIIRLNPPSAGTPDLDSKIHHCQFVGNIETHSIVTYGRGLEIFSCGFSGNMKESAIQCFMTRQEGGIRGTDKFTTDQYGGRAFLFHDNRIHLIGKYFIHIAVNEAAPYCVFHGIRINDNYSDVGSHLCKIDAPNYGTFIGNNTFTGGRPYADSFFINITDPENLTIVNNIFIGPDMADNPEYKTSRFKFIFNSSGRLYGENDSRVRNMVKNVIISDNIICSEGYLLQVGKVKGMIIANNLFTDNSFPTATYRGIVRSWDDCEKVVITGNINMSPEDVSGIVMSGNDRNNNTLKHIHLKGNSGIENLISFVSDSKLYIQEWTIEDIQVDETVLDYENLPPNKRTVINKHNVE